MRLEYTPLSQRHDSDKKHSTHAASLRQVNILVQWEYLDLADNRASQESKTILDMADAAHSSAAPNRRWHWWGNCNQKHAPQQDKTHRIL